MKTKIQRYIYSQGYYSDFRNTLNSQSQPGGHIFCTGLIPRILNPVAMTLAVASQSRRRLMLTFTIAPEKQVLKTLTIHFAIVHH